MSQAAVQGRSKESGRESLAVLESPEPSNLFRQRLPTQSPGSSSCEIRTPQSAICNSAPDRLYHIILLALSAVVLLLAALLMIRDRSQVIVPVLQLPLPELCTMRRMFGIDCPGCGLTRCFIALAHGDVAAAWSYNPAGLWLFLIMAIQIPFRSYQLWRLHRGQRELLLPWAMQITFAVLAIALLAQWTLRLAGMTF